MTLVDWHWMLLDIAGNPASADAVVSAGQRFPSQSDAETWLGEMWPDLRDAGVGAVSLYESDRLVYGPMSLHPGS